MMGWLTCSHIHEMQTVAFVQQWAPVNTRRHYYAHPWLSLPYPFNQQGHGRFSLTSDDTSRLIFILIRFVSIQHKA